MSSPFSGPAFCTSTLVSVILLEYGTDIELSPSAVIASGISLYYRYQLSYGPDINWNEGAFVATAYDVSPDKLEKVH